MRASRQHKEASMTGYGWWELCRFPSSLATDGFLQGSHRLHIHIFLAHFTFDIWFPFLGSDVVSRCQALLQAFWGPGLETGLDHWYRTAALTDGYASSAGWAHAIFIQAVPPLLRLPLITLYIFPCLPGSSTQTSLKFCLRSDLPGMTFLQLIHDSSGWIQIKPSLKKGWYRGTLRFNKCWQLRCRG